LIASESGIVLTCDIYQETLSTAWICLFGEWESGTVLRTVDSGEANESVDELKASESENVFGIDGGDLVEVRLIDHGALCFCENPF
jgi:hypothetical protein